MPPELYLHEHKDFEALIRIVADDLSIDPILAEKDYWIMHCLYGLKELKLEFELKGGTSLSKGFNVIDRFSEDIDIRIDPACAPFEVFSGKNHDKYKHIESRHNFYDWLADEKIEIPGITEVNRDTDFDDEKYRSGGIRLIYQSKFELLEGVREGILLESGFDTTAPNEAVDITSWAFEHTKNSDVDVINNVAREIKCYLPEYTFVEKLQTISTKFRQQQENESDPIPFMRHYNDVAQLLNQERVLNFIGTKEYEEHKQRRFRAGDEKVIANNEAFLLTDRATRDSYSEAYEKTSSLYYRKQISLDEILDVIHQNIENL